MTLLGSPKKRPRYADIWRFLSEIALFPPSHRAVEAFQLRSHTCKASSWLLVLHLFNVRHLREASNVKDRDQNTKQELGGNSIGNRKFRKKKKSQTKL